MWRCLLLLLTLNLHAATGVELALAGRCDEAMPLLDAAMRDASLSEAGKRPVSTAGVRCSMLLNRQTDALSFLAWLQDHNPQDPEVLFLAVHVFSELSQRNASALMKTAPDSPLVIQLNAEAFEKRGDLPKAIAEYRVLAAKAPDRLGVHYRAAGLLLSQGNTDEARQEFAAELKLDSRNASAEYYLGELSARPADALTHFRRAVELYPAFAEAQSRLGRTLLDLGQTPAAIEALEKAAQLAPTDPATHQFLATAYQRAGRKADAAREFAQQKSTAAARNDQEKTLRRTVSGVQ